MAGQSDGSIIIDTEVNSEGLKAGSQELLSAIKSLSGEIKTLGETLKDAFSQKITPELDTAGAEKKVAELEAKVKDLENALASMQGSSSTTSAGGGGTAVQPSAGAQLTATTEKAGALQRQIESLKNGVENLEPTFEQAMQGSESAMNSFDSKAAALENKIESIKEKLEAVGAQKIPTEDYQWLQNEITRTNKELDGYIEKQIRMEALDVDKQSKPWIALCYDIDLAKEKLNAYETEAKSMETAGTAYTAGTDTAAYQQMESTLAEASNRLREMQIEAQTTQQPMSTIGDRARSIASGLGAAVKTAMSFPVQLLAKGAAHLRDMKAHAVSMDGAFGKLISGAKKFGMAVLGARSVYNLLRKAVSAYMASNTQLASTLSSCWTAIGNSIGPIIERIVNFIATAVAYLTQFLALLGFTGKSAAKAIGKAGSAAGGAADDLKRELASFDELNILKDDNSGGGGGGGGTGAGTGNLPDVTLPDWVTTMTNQLKAYDWAAAANTLTTQLNAMIESVDWAGIGDKIGFWVNGALAFIATAITTFDWMNLGVSLATSINHFIAGVDWSNLGVILGAKFKIAIETLAGIVSTLNWAGIGTAIADVLTGLFKTIDLTTAAQTLQNTIIGLLTVITTAVFKVNWKALGSTVATAINAIDWKTLILTGVQTIVLVAEALYDLITSALAGINWSKLGSDLWETLVSIVSDIKWNELISKAFALLGVAVGSAYSLISSFAKGVWTSIKAAFEATKTYFETYVKEAGGNVLDGLWNGIKAALADIGQWVIDNIWTPFINGVKAAFGIGEGSSSGMEAYGEQVAKDFMEGIKNGITGLATSTGKAVRTGFNKVIDIITGKSNEAVEEVETGAERAHTGAGRHVQATEQEVSTAADTMHKNVTSSIDGIVRDGGGGLTEFSLGAGRRMSEVADKTEQGFTRVEASVSAHIINGHKVLDTETSGMKSSMETATSGMQTTVTRGFDEIRNTVSTKMSETTSAISGTNWSSIGSNLVSGLKNGISSAWSAVSNTVSSLASSLTSGLKSLFRIGSPSKLWRDEIGWWLGLGLAEGIGQSESEVLASAENVVNATADKLAHKELSIGNVIPTAEMDGALTTFSDKIANSFSGLLDRLAAIADNVAFTTPNVAAGIVPYRASAAAASSGNIGNIIETSNDEMESVVSQVVSQAAAAIVRAIDNNKGGSVGTTGIGTLADKVVAEINRKTRVTGRSPLLL